MGTSARHSGDLGLTREAASAIKDLEAGKFSAANALTADTGSDQAGATPLTAVINRVTTVGTAGDSVLLPAAKKGAMLVVINAHASNSADVFPSTGDKVNALSANAAYALAATKVALFVCAVDGTWNTLLTA